VDVHEHVDERKPELLLDESVEPPMGQESRVERLLF